MERAHMMMQDDNHSMWNGSAFLTEVEKKFGYHKISIQHVLELINTDIKTLGDQLYALTAHDGLLGVDREDQNEKLHQKLTSLRNHINDFRDLLQQDCTTNHQESSVKALCHFEEEVNRFRAVQKVADDLYGSFLLACQQHQQHRIWLQIEIDNCLADEVKFYLVLSPILTCDDNANIQDKTELSLVIESSLSTSSSTASTSTRTSGHVWSVGSDSDDGLGLKQEQTCTDHKMDHRGQKRRKIDNMRDHVKRPTLEPKIHNFCEEADMCSRISKGTLEPCKEDLLLGILSSTENSCHAVYALSKAVPGSNRRLEDKLQYLARILESTDENIAMPQHSKISPAKKFSIAVLQYNSTPWLRQSWDSNHILIEKDKSQYSSSERTIPGTDLEDSRNILYLEAAIQNLSDMEEGNSSDVPRSMIRNMILFRLGIMLVELAYNRPFPSMLKLTDDFEHRDARLSRENTDYCAADRLQRGIARKFGPVYARLVRQCINCDFGHGHDLAQVELQEGFYEHVVDKLEVLEAKFKDLGI